MLTGVVKVEVWRWRRGGFDRGGDGSHECHDAGTDNSVEDDGVTERVDEVCFTGRDGFLHRFSLAYSTLGVTWSHRRMGTWT